jgi:hypothetical protein
MAGIGGGTMVFDTITHSQEGFVYPFLVKLDAGLSVDIPEKNPSNKNLILFPNPAFDQVNLRSGFGKEKVRMVNVYDLSGSLILTKVLDGRQSFSVTNLKRGVYFVEIVSEDGDSTIEKLTLI